MKVRNKEIIEQLKKQVLAIQGLKRPLGVEYPNMGLGEIEKAFPGSMFPFGLVHEFISPNPESASATNGFISGLLGKLINSRGLCLWISSRRTIFPAALKMFNIKPDQVIFIDLKTDKDVLWAVEEALKSEALSAVVGEVKELDFTQSRKLQLAVEKSRVTGFIHRYQPRTENSVTCVTRWKITPLPSSSIDNLPGLGFPRWHVDLTKVRNGTPDCWNVEWVNNEFRQIANNDLKVVSSPAGIVNYA